MKSEHKHLRYLSTAL
uniref:Uncharacterized protein n=1 Tax=Anguilla anguilla TaxID=7936 RepID=A0A0E9S266_ANGAN